MFYPTNELWFPFTQNGIPRYIADENDHPHPIDSLQPGSPPGPKRPTAHKSLIGSPGRIGLPSGAGRSHLQKKIFCALHAQIDLGNDSGAETGSTMLCSANDDPIVP